MILRNYCLKILVVIMLLGFMLYSRHMLYHEEMMPEICLKTSNVVGREQ